MKAKLGAELQGDPDTVSQFFTKELHFRRQTYGYQFWNQSESETGSDPEGGEESRVRLAWDWIANATLWLTVGYGERPGNVVLTSLLIIGLFTPLYFVHKPPIEDPTLLEYPTFSLQSFIQLIVGGSSGNSEPSVVVKFLTAMEGFLGAFIIALFVITLTRSIDR
jgi:hypothetical protein